MSQVVIAGGGTVGLAAAVFLGQQGIPVLVLERRTRPSVHPRALGVSPRTLELFRSAGLSEAIDAVAVRSAVPGKADARTVAEIDRTQPSRAPRFTGPDLSPETPRGHYSQDRLDSVLLPAAHDRGATIEIGVAVTGVEQDADGVDVSLSDGRTVRAAYLIGADGVNTTVRAALGIGTTGPGEIGDTTLNILFDADLVGRFGPLPMLTEISHPDARGMLLAVGEGRWVFHTKPPADGRFTDETCAASIRTALGADVPLEIVSVLPWRATVRMADAFRSGRAFLVGDAARAISPLGGFGLNTGIADAHNLAWKLAMVLTGRAGDRLLDSYHEERHALAQIVTAQAMLRWANPRLHWDPSEVAERDRAGAWYAPMVTMGYRYDSSAIAGPVPPLPSTEDVAAALDGAPGSHLRHRWIDGVSTLDMIGPGFTLLTGSEEWDDAARTLDLPVVRIDGDWPESVGIDATGALLVRPDAFIAWRSVKADADALPAVLAAVTGGRAA
ncbi:FAD-dependent monooxygenase [Pseudonocardia xinjiangensis]|uniref:Oxidase n=1 Tax=Pseudonocardia xinjiangensis TaxID=75289 RepID=A0ABX1RGU6_9PSEU|nr:FAD-dependent monooxygenase [Pseudonocardia xinjiangensis]NMH78386.1 oxidase [Pseudonocardia xinjiangensis]